MSRILVKTLEQKVILYSQNGVIRIVINFQSIILFSTGLIFTAIYFYFDPHILLFFTDSVTEVADFELYLAFFISAPALVLIINSIRESLVRYPITVDARRGTLIAGRRQYSFSEIDDIFVVYNRLSSRSRYYSLIVKIGGKEINFITTFGDGKLQSLLDIERRIEETVFAGRTERNSEETTVPKGKEIPTEDLHLHIALALPGSILSIAAWLFFPEYEITHLNSDLGMPVWQLGVALIYSGFLYAMGYPLINKMVSDRKSEKIVAMMVFLIPIALSIFLRTVSSR